MFTHPGRTLQKQDSSMLFCCRQSLSTFPHTHLRDPPLFPPRRHHEHQLAHGEHEQARWVTTTVCVCLRLRVNLYPTHN